MYLKFTRHEKVKALANNATAKIELPEAGVLTAIKLAFEAANASGIHNANKARIVDRLTKVEITDGGTDTMESLTGQCFRALDFYHLKQVMSEAAILYGAKTQRSSIIIPFGEYIGDPKRGLDLGAWDEVDLEITNDAGATQWADTALKVDVELISMMDLPAVPSSYYKHYQWRAEKPAAAGQYVRHQLPTTERVKRYFVQVDPDLETAGNPTADPTGDAYLWDFSFKERTEYVFKDARPKDVMRYNAGVYGQVQTAGRYFASATQYFDLGIGYATNAPAGWCTDAVPAATDYLEMAESNDRYQVVKGVAGVNFADVIAQGVGYYHTFVPFDSMSGEEPTFLDCSKTGKGPVYLDWFGSAASHTVRSILTVSKKQGET